MSFRLLLLTLLLLASGSSLAAQRTTLVAGVADAESGAALEDAIVRLPSFGLVARTDALGRARLAGVKAGIWTVEVRHIGYAPLRVELAFGGSDSLDAVLMLHRTVGVLDTVHVRAEAVPARLRLFEWRRANGIGRYRTRTELLAQHGDRELLDVAPQLFPGVRRVTNGTTPRLAGTRGPSCLMGVFIDGRAASAEEDISWVRTSDLAGVEYYSGSSAPPQFRLGACGVLVLWLYW